jgi:CHAT domain-containing protein/Tfp pilus assembly protein PilF
MGIKSLSGPGKPILTRAIRLCLAALATRDAVLKPLLSLLLWCGPVAVSVSSDGLPISGHQPATQYVKPETIQTEVRQLMPSATIERELASGDVHAYHITLASEQYLRVIVNQRGVDVVVTVFAPDGRQIAEVDSPIGTQGPESISVIAEDSGDYRLEVRAFDKQAAPGRYEVHIEEQREATPQDRSRLAAERASATALQLRRQGGAESLRRAIEKHQEALSLWRAATDHRGQAQTLHHLGTDYRLLGEYQNALASFDQALPLWRIVGDHAGEAETLDSLGLIYRLQGEPEKALGYYQQALKLWRIVMDRRGEAQTLNNIGWAYGSVGQPEKVLDYYRHALELWRAVNDRSGEATALNSIGGVYRSSGEYQKALDCYEQALRLWRALGDRRSEAQMLNNIGYVYASMGEPQQALAYYEQAIPLQRALGDRYGEAFTLNSLGYAYASLGDPQQARACFDQALPLRRAIGDREGEASTLAGIARVERDRGKLRAAQDHIEAALGIIESLRANISRQDLRFSYRAAKQNYYELYVDLLMRLHQHQPAQGHDAAALHASERARARTLLDTLVEARADIRQGVDPALLERERILQQRVNATSDRLTRLRNRQPTDDQATAAEKELRDVLAQYQDVQAHIRATSPRYAALTQPQPLGLREIQQQVLDDDTMLLEYALGDERSFLWAVTPTSISSFELPKRVEIEKVARRVYDLLTARNKPVRFEKKEKRRARIAQADADFPEAAAALSQMILGPVANQLGNKRLLMVSDGVLQYIPLAALPAPRKYGSVGVWEYGRSRTDRSTPTRPHAHTPTPPLIVDHEIVNLPSASVLAVLRRELAGRKPAPKSVAVLADPVFESDDLRVKISRTEKKPTELAKHTGEARHVGYELERAMRDVEASEGRLEIPRLIFTRQEAETITTLAPKGKEFKALDFVANRVTATSADLSQYQFVHFATHGLLNSQHPELSGLVLSLVDSQGQPQDGFLRLHEIYNLKLPAELVVLSGCRTGLGKEIKGEGLVGLTRGFMYAGAARVVASLWGVNDEATADLMKAFYRGMLAERLPAAAALRAAQVAMWKRGVPPYYWAAFTLQGEWR